MIRKSQTGRVKKSTDGDATALATVTELLLFRNVGLMIAARLDQATRHAMTKKTILRIRRLGTSHWKFPFTKAYPTVVPLDKYGKSHHGKRSLHTRGSAGRLSLG